jgi:hypothetical protein
MCGFVCWYMLRTWQQNILFFDTLAGLLLGIYSASISAFFVTNLQLLGGWLVFCTIVILAPVVWWMPFIPQEKAEKGATDTIKERNPDVRNVLAESDQTKLRGCKWHVIVSASNKDGGGVSFEVVVNAKFGNIELVR